MSLYENYYVNDSSRMVKSNGIKPEIHGKPIIIKRATSEAFRTVNPVLEDGQPALETDTNILKVGDGKTKYNDLKPISGSGSSGGSGGSGSGSEGGSGGGSSEGDLSFSWGTF